MKNFYKSGNVSLINLCLTLLIVSYSNVRKSNCFKVTLPFSVDINIVPGHDLAGIKAKIDVLQE